MSTQLEDLHFDSEFFQQKLPHHYRAVLQEFQKISSSFVHFNLLFILLGAAELTFFFSFLPLLSHSAVFAVAIGVLFLTLFSYLVLLFYYQAKKPEQLHTLLQTFIASCRTSLNLPTGIAQHHLSIAETLTKLSHYLQDYEWRVLKIPSVFAPLSRLMARFSAFCYWHDVFRFKQLLLYAAIEEHLLQIRATPTDLEVHASMASTYVLLSQIYKEPRGEATHPRMKIYRKYASLFDEKFKTAGKFAIEEFRILSQYAPNDPWVHEQLASGYHELDMPEEEVAELETLFKLKPQDREICFRLGILYFQLGQNVKGLQIYEELKKANFKKAEDLMINYGKTAHGQTQTTPLVI
jgi:tetratricopeptide (TPR) repeat protein